MDDKQSDKQGKKVALLVDDDPFLAKIYTKQLEGAGYELHVASSAKEALSLLHGELSPNVILVDVEMQGMNGIEFIKALHEENLAKNAVIMVLSNQSDESVREEAQQLGIAGYILKSEVLPSEVIRIIKSKTEGRHISVETEK